MKCLAGCTAVILAGGRGSRLRSLTGRTQKVVLPVGGKPFLHHLLDQVGRGGIRQVVLCVGYKAGDVRRVVGERYGELHITYSVESTPLGTGGALRGALEAVRHGPLVVMNGDSYCEVDWAALRQYHLKKGAEATIVLTRVSDVSRYGRVVLSESGLITGFSEKATEGGPGWINAGIYLLERGFVELVPPGGAVSLEREIFPSRAGRSLYGFPGGGRFIDIGTPRSYREAEKFFQDAGNRGTV